MGDLLSKEMLADLIINIINILILFLVTKKLLYKPVKKYLDARKAKVASAFAEAEKAKQDADAAKAQADSLIQAETETKEKLLKEAQNEASQKAASIIREAEKQADGIISEARDQAKLAHDKAIGESKDEIADIALQISEKIMGRSVTDEDNKRIIDSFFAD